MGVLMKGVDMPKNCEECNFKGECRDYWEKIREAYTRPSWCPLVEVADRKTEPKHGEWIVLGGTDLNGISYCAKCSNCKAVYDGIRLSNYSYCPNCGVRMFPTQMSER